MNTLHSDAFKDCEDLIESFACSLWAPPVELLEDALIFVNRRLKVTHPGVTVELDRYSPCFRGGALRISDGAYISGMPMVWREDYVAAADGDFLGRFDLIEENRREMAHDMLSYIVRFIASRLADR